MKKRKLDYGSLLTGSVPFFLLTLIITQIRKTSAEQVYLVLLQNGNLVSEESMEKALEIVIKVCDFHVVLKI